LISFHPSLTGSEDLIEFQRSLGLEQISEDEEKVKVVVRKPLGPKDRMKFKFEMAGIELNLKHSKEKAGTLRVCDFEGLHLTSSGWYQ
jgi:hypothetical protein